MNTVYISLGSNRGKRQENLERSIAQLNEKVGQVVLRSSLYETEPWKMDDAKSFLNQVVELQTTLSVEKLMDTLLGIEAFLGRVRREGKYTARTIDLDILFYNNDVISTEKVKVPHPLLHERKFVLEPLMEIAPNLLHPLLNKNISQLLKECKDTYLVAKAMSK